MRIKFSLIMLLAGVALFISCNRQDLGNADLDLSNLSFENFSFEFKPVTVSLKDYPLDKLWADLAAELMAENSVTNTKPRASGEEVLIGVDLAIFGEEVLITPLGGAFEGGDCGDGLTSYGTFTDQEDVIAKLKEIGEDLGESGQCLDLRLRRTLLNARICGRMKDC